MYIALGWGAVIYLSGFWQAGGAPVATSLFLRRVLSTVGAVVYGVRRPDPDPCWFGFHALTVVGFAAHRLGITIALTTT